MDAFDFLDTKHEETEQINLSNTPESFRVFHVDLWEKRVAILLEGTHFFPDKPVDQNYEKMQKYIRQTNKQKNTRRKNNKQTDIGGEGIFLTLERLDQSHERTNKLKQNGRQMNKQTNYLTAITFPCPLIFILTPPLRRPKID